jgi:hypothetical protein
MEENLKVKLDDFLILWGFILSIFGFIGIVQLGIMDGLVGFIPAGLILLAIGILILCFITVIDSRKKIY